MEVQKSQKIPQEFCCENCDYYTSNKKDYEKHLLTLKHKRKSKGSVQEDEKSHNYMCECGKTCKTHGGIWKHKQKCNYDIDSNNDSINDIPVSEAPNTIILVLFDTLTYDNIFFVIINNENGLSY